jgi:hypothetical protein
MSQVESFDPTPFARSCEMIAKSQTCLAVQRLIEGVRVDCVSITQ